MIDLRSDTVTQPTRRMRQVMMDAPVGDDVYGEDPSVNALEARAAQMLGKDNALFVSSGTQSNLIALLTHCARGDEYIVGQTAHTYRFEGGGAAVLGGIQPQPLDLNPDGSMDLELVASYIKPDDVHFAKTKLLCLENTHNGQRLPLEFITKARALCDQHNLQLHLDGARFFNAIAAQPISSQKLAEPFDSVSICLSKGLGAPIGSVLAGSNMFISEARRWRKMLGGGMRQAGVVAAAGLYGLENNIDRLIQDHRHAEQLAETLSSKFGQGSVQQATNMIHLNLEPARYEKLRAHMRNNDVMVDRPRWVFHLGISPQDIDKIINLINILQI